MVFVVGKDEMIDGKKSFVGKMYNEKISSRKCGSLFLSSIQEYFFHVIFPRRFSMSPIPFFISVISNF